MVAPALVATTVPAGTHRIIFRYRGWPNYPLLFGIVAAALLALAYTGQRDRQGCGRLMKSRRPRGTTVESESDHDADRGVPRLRRLDLLG
jgi:hypothetical protein